METRHRMARSMRHWESNGTVLQSSPVATITTQSGVSPLYRHLMFMNFSAPMSAPKPASVTTKPSGPTSFSASASATMDELPCAMLAKGPGVQGHAVIRVLARS